jgi:transcriptional regulator with XRE-family HTH domain
MEASLHDRLRMVTGDRTYRMVAELTEFNQETTRRYLQGQAPSAEFLAAICRVFGVSGDWLLTGRGPMRADEVRHHALREATAADLLTAMANTLTTLLDRVERLEVFVQTVDARLRVVPAQVEPKPTGPYGKAKPIRTNEDAVGSVNADASRVAADRIGRAVAQRPPSDAG